VNSFTPYVQRTMSLTKRNAEKTQKFPFAANTATELKKNVPNTSDNTGTILSQNVPRQMPVLSDIFDILCVSISVFNSKWAIFLGCATMVFGERCDVREEDADLVQCCR